MSCELLSGDNVTSLSLDADSHTLRGQLINDAGNPVDDAIDLRGFIANIDGEFMWGGGNFSKTAKSIQLDVKLKADELLKDSPRDRQPKAIYSIDHIPDSNLHFTPKRVGKLEPPTILGAASFPATPLYDARQFSVSNLDGDNILVEHIPKYYAQMLGGQK
ncbi:hypothetical protein EV426DRAFT_710547 [Tirmania nivea]|nr:hypothetical protein EV426DRAFT_710547 [Tirmania nivea]